VNARERAEALMRELYGPDWMMSRGEIPTIEAAILAAVQAEREAIAAWMKTEILADGTADQVAAALWFAKAIRARSNP